MENLKPVDSKSLQIPKNIILAFSILQKVSSALAGKFAVKLFLKPINYPTPKRELAFKSSLPEIIEEVNGKTFSLNIIGNEKPKILLIHGWSGRASQFYKLGSALSDKNISYATFTATAHGNSNAKETSLVDFIASTELILEKHGSIDILIGHSLGGVAALNAASKNNAIKKLITIGSPASITSSIDDFCNILNLNKKVNRIIIQYIKTHFSESFEEQSASFLAKDATAKGLVIHDVQDNDVKVESAKIIHEYWKESELLITKKLGHRRILSDQKVIDAILDFINQ